MTGTDFNCDPWKQREFDFHPPLLFVNDEIGRVRLKAEIKRRTINEKTYKVVKVKIVELEEEDK